MKKRTPVAAVTLAISALFLSTHARAEEYLTGIEWAEPKVINPGPPGGPPCDAVVLFDGTDMSHWNGAEKWTVEDGAVIHDTHRGRRAEVGGPAAGGEEDRCPA